MPLTVGTLGMSAGNADEQRGRVLEYQGGSGWTDLTFNLNTAIDGILGMKYLDGDLFISTNAHGVFWLDRDAETWQAPAWTSGIATNITSIGTFYEHQGKYYYGGANMFRLGDPRLAAELRVETGYANIVGIITSLAGQPELTVGYWGNDSWMTFSLPDLTEVYNDNPGGSCVFDMIEYEGIIHAVNYYGWCYRSTDGRQYGTGVNDPNMAGAFEDITPEPAPDAQQMWCLFTVWSDAQGKNLLYGGTCAETDDPILCDIRLFDGELWTSSLPVVTHNTTVYGQGFIRGLQDVHNIRQAYVSTGIGYYDAGNTFPNESRCYIFDGDTLTDISPPDPVRPDLCFGMGIQCMTFSPAISGWSVGDMQMRVG
jgi:hypothetical protein